MEKRVIEKPSSLVPLIGFFFTAYFLVARYIWPINLETISEEWLTAELILFSILSLSCWLVFGHRRGLFFTGSTAFLVLVIILRTGTPKPYNLLLLNFIIAGIFYLHFRRIEKRRALNEREIEKIVEDENVLWLKIPVQDKAVVCGL